MKIITDAQIYRDDKKLVNESIEQLKGRLNQFNRFKEIWGSADEDALADIRPIDSVNIADLTK